MKKNPGLAAVLSLFVPGVGQIYNGAFLRGLFWLVITPGFWIGTGGWLGWVCHLLSAFTAYRYAERRDRARFAEDGLDRAMRRRFDSFLSSARARR